MARVLCYVGRAAQALSEATTSLLGVAAGVGEPIAVVATGPEGPSPELVAELARRGASAVYAGDLGDGAGLLTVGEVALLEAAVGALGGGLAAVLVPSSTAGREIGGRLALRIGGALLVDVVALDAGQGDPGRLVTTHDVWGGSFVSRAHATAGVPVIAVRAGVGGAAPAAQEAPVAMLELTGSLPPAARIVGTRPAEAAGADRPALGVADIVVAGGRGVGSVEGFGLVEEVAEALGAAVGASRAAVEAGYCDKSLQVGQTGVIVAPRVYLALGISGALQHRMGMQTSEVVIAVNKDSEAPIFEIADLGVVGDVHAIVPQLLTALAENGAAS